MTGRHLLQLTALAAIWGGSFLFMRIGAPEMGPVMLIALRTAIAGLFLLPFLYAYRAYRDVRENLPLIALVGILGSAIPFSLLAYATLHISAGFASVLNATTPLSGALVAGFWLQERLSVGALLGLLVGFSGVIVLVWGRGHLPSVDFGLAVVAALGATLFYALAANITMRWLKAVKPLALASLSQVFAALALTPLALLLLPDQMPSMDAWWSVILLGVVCTGAAYILYFHLIRQVGSTKTLTVTYLIPAFGLFWGWAFLQEEVTWSTIVGCLLILAGVGMTSGVFSRRPGGATSA